MKNTEAQLRADYDRAVASLTNAAWDNDLLDVAYGFVDSPFGRLLVATTRRGLVRVEYPNGGIDEQIEGLAVEVSPRVLESSRHTQAVRRELDEYFEGKRQSFNVPVDLSFLRGFGRRVLEQTAGIPFGMLATYRDVATRAGSPRASRAAGNALAANPVPIVVPCHRVVHSGGGLGGYTGGLDRKITLLRLEGVDVPPYRPPRTKGAALRA
ncbi:MAG TPA: methylated-DNA--[protein]-cysteine S-methyltransferase [Actinomycetota bacterium]|nr:methylated-DNA--[protein]-cysteine S-methyltransferase [Actinomycetota bacterium]